LMLIRYYALKKEFTRALESIDRVDKSVGGDPYLDLARADINESQGNLERARRLAFQAIEREPNLLHAYLAVVGLSLKTKNYDETLAMLKELDRKFGIDMKDLKTVPEYAGFARSPQFRQWLDYVEKVAKKADSLRDRGPKVTVPPASKSASKD